MNVYSNGVGDATENARLSRVTGPHPKSCVQRGSRKALQRFWKRGYAFDMPTRLKSYRNIKPGDFYEDCALHPCLCIRVSAEAEEIEGVSLIDGSFPRTCSLNEGEVLKLTCEEALERKMKFGRQSR